MSEFPICDFIKSFPSYEHFLSFIVSLPPAEKEDFDRRARLEMQRAIQSYQSIQAQLREKEARLRENSSDICSGFGPNNY